MGLESSKSGKRKTTALVDALREVFIEPKGRLSYRDILNLSSSYSQGKSDFLSETRRFMEERFSGQILHVVKTTRAFESAEIDVERVNLVRDSVCSWVSMVYGTLGHEEVPEAGHRKEIVELECVGAIESLKTITETLQSHAQVIDAVTKVLLPLNRKCYFMDREMNLVEKTYYKMLFKALKKCKAGMRRFVGLVLLVSNITLACGGRFDGADEFSAGIRYFLKVLDGFGMKSKVLASTRELIAEQDFHILFAQRNDFEAVSRYFGEQKYIYPSRFHRNVEALVLAKLYSDFDESFILDRLAKLEGLEFALMLFVKGGIKHKLLKVYERFIECIRSNFREHFRIYIVNREVLRIFDDEEFRSISRSFFEGFFESSDVCIQVSDFVDQSLGVAPDDAYDVIACITEESKNPENFLKELQQRLSLRLLSGSSDLERETRFLKHLKRMHSENMASMVSDYRNKEPSLLLMTMCKWPAFRTENVSLPDSHPVALFKREVEVRLRESRKRVSWMDSLSKVRFELFGRTLEATLFQYSILTKVVQHGKVIARSQFHVYFESSDSSGVASTVRIERSAIKVPKAYSGQFSSLLGSVLLQTEEFFVLNPYFTGPIACKYEFQSCPDESEDDCSYNVRAFYEAKISRALKRSKEMTLEELQNRVGDIELDEMKKYLTGLQEKGFVELSGNKAIYCP